MLITLVFIIINKKTKQNQQNKQQTGLLDLYNKEKEKNKELNIKINRIKEIIDTSPYTAYTAYGNILYDDQAIRDIIEDTNKFEGDIW